MAGTEQAGYSDHLAPPFALFVSLAVNSTVPLTSLSAARALRRSPIPSAQASISQRFLLETLELRLEAVSVGYLLRFPCLEHGDRQVPLLVAVHRERARCETLRYSPPATRAWSMAWCWGLEQMVQLLGIRSPGEVIIQHFTPRMALGSYSRTNIPSRFTSTPGLMEPPGHPIGQQMPFPPKLA